MKLRPEGEKVAFRVESSNADLCEVELFGGSIMRWGSSVFGVTMNFNMSENIFVWNQVAAF